MSNAHVGSITLCKWLDIHPRWLRCTHFSGDCNSTINMPTIDQHNNQIHVVLRCEIAGWLQTSESLECPLLVLVCGLQSMCTLLLASQIVGKTVHSRRFPKHDSAHISINMCVCKFPGGEHIGNCQNNSIYRSDPVNASVLFVQWKRKQTPKSVYVFFAHWAIVEYKPHADNPPETHRERVIILLLGNYLARTKGKPFERDTIQQ